MLVGDFLVSRRLLKPPPPAGCGSAPGNDPVHTNDLSRLTCRSASGPHADSHPGALWMLRPLICAALSSIRMSYRPRRHAWPASIATCLRSTRASERSIAEGLGVDLADVRNGLITGEVARRIVRTHPSLDSAVITGIAFDSLFRQLCAEQALATPEGRQVLAPFAFVSAWAGV